MNDPIALLRALVEQGPYWYWDPREELVGNAYLALCCDLRSDELEDMEDECAHDETCPWRLAKEYLENIG